MAGFPYRVGPSGMFFYPEYLYRTEDGYVYVIVHNDEVWRRLCARFGRPDMGQDPQVLQQRGEASRLEEAHGGLQGS